MDQSASGLDLHTRQDVKTPVGTPSPPNAASTVARPPPRPRRQPLINFLPTEMDDSGGMIKNLSLESSSVSFTRKHTDTPHPSPSEKNSSVETVIPKDYFAIDPKYLAPTPGPVVQDVDDHKIYLSDLFDTLLEDVEPPSGIFLLEMTQKDETKQHEFASLAAQQKLDSVHEEMFEMAQEQMLDSGDLEGFGQENVFGMLNAAEKSNEERNRFNLEHCSFPSDLADFNEFSGTQQGFGATFENINCAEQVLEQANEEHMDAQDMDAQHMDAQNMDSQNMDSQHMDSQHTKAQHIDAKHMDAEQSISEVYPDSLHQHNSDGQPSFTEAQQCLTRAQQCISRISQASQSSQKTHKFRERTFPHSQQSVPDDLRSVTGALMIKLWKSNLNNIPEFQEKFTTAQQSTSEFHPSSLIAQQSKSEVQQSFTGAQQSLNEAQQYFKTDQQVSQPSMVQAQKSSEIASEDIPETSHTTKSVQQSQNQSSSENAVAQEASPESIGFQQEASKSESDESITDYFQHRTSNLGTSLGSNSGSKLASLRPNFGLDIMNSPKPDPKPMVTLEDIVKETISLSESKHHDLSIKEQNQMHEIAAMLLTASPGHEAKYYANIVLKKMLEKQKQELEATLHVTQFMPSFLEDSGEWKSKRNSIVKMPSFLQDSGEWKSKRNSIVKNRHSSPKKLTKPKSHIPRRVPMENITNAHVEPKKQLVKVNKILLKIKCIWNLLSRYVAVGGLLLRFDPSRISMP